MPQIELNSSFNQSFYTQLSQNVSDSEDSSDEDELIRFQSPPRASTAVSYSHGNNAATTAVAPHLVTTDAPKRDNHPILMTPHSEEMYLNSAVRAATISGSGNGPKSLACTLNLGGSGGNTSSENSNPTTTTTTTNSDTVAILNDGGVNSTNQQDDETMGHFLHRKPMGPCRKICFFLSIVVCFASVALFLWGLPCDNELTCSVLRRSGAGVGQQDEESRNWIRNFDKVEFKSVISVTNGMPGYGKNLIFMYR